MKILEKFNEFKNFISSIFKGKKADTTTEVEVKVERNLIEEEKSLNVDPVPEVYVAQKEKVKEEPVKKEPVVKKKENPVTETKAETVKDIKSKAASSEKVKKMDAKPVENTNKPKKKYKPRTPKSE